MKEEVKEKWLNALRSGEYAQGVEKLRTNDKFCCLGVLCDIYRKETNEGDWFKVNERDYYEFRDGGVQNYSILSHNIVEWSGIKDSNPRMSSGMLLAHMNDVGRSFNEIADIIEEEL